MIDLSVSSVSRDVDEDLTTRPHDRVTTYRRDEWRKRETTISRKRPELARRRRNLANDGRCEDDYDHCSHRICSGVVLRRVKEQLNERVFCICVQKTVDISKRVTNGDSHDEAHYAVNDDSRYYRLWQCD